MSCWFLCVKFTYRFWKKNSNYYYIQWRKEKNGVTLVAKFSFLIAIQIPYLFVYLFKPPEEIISSKNERFSQEFKNAGV